MSKFTEQFKKTQQRAYEVNVGNGWWAERILIRGALLWRGIDYKPHLAIELLGLAGTEISEAIEAARKHDPSTWRDSATKDTMVRECAGTIVRLMDLCEYLGLPLGEAIEKEIEENSKRGFKHGGKAA